MPDTRDEELPDAPPVQLLVPPELHAAADGNRIPSEAELDEKFPNRPRNHGETLPFHHLYETLFEPLLANRKVIGKRGITKLKPHEVRRNIIDQFFARWRTKVGDDVFPAFRLIIPDRDRDRSVYHLKEQKIGKLLVKVMQITKESEDGHALLHWRQPGAAARSAGDFALRCHEVIKKRPMRTEPGTMTIAQVNSLLDKLTFTMGEGKQIPILAEFYRNMNADEMMWLIRIILRQMKIGATEKTFFDAWHPDADALFNVSSSLRRVCWELWDPNFRLQDDTKGVTLMSCFQPQLAQFQKKSLDAVIKAMGGQEFWIEEKLDGERMQMHYHRGQFKWWSRKAKSYDYLYGEEYEGEKSGAMTRFLQDAFNEKVSSIILDGEMIEWDPNLDCVVGFGTLKTAAIAVRDNNGQSNKQPLYRVFDILHLNGKCLIDYSLEDRRKALSSVLSPVHRRVEIHSYKPAMTAGDIEHAMRDIVATSAEGLVIKNPRSAYRLNDRNDDWVKVKPEYMTEFGESLDCLIIGAYWGSGKRGNVRSSYLCGLRVDGNHRKPGDPENRFWSFFKVGSGFTANEYAVIGHKTEGKWIPWDHKNPPREYYELAGGDKLLECPDEWIRPENSFVVEVKAASVGATSDYRAGVTLRFPRFKRFRDDKNWRTALSLSEFLQLRADADKEVSLKKMDIEAGRRTAKRQKKTVTVMGGEEAKFQPAPPPSSENPLFEGQKFFVLSDCASPKKSKDEIVQAIKAHAGAIFLNDTAAPGIIPVADRATVKASALRKRNGVGVDIVHPRWIFDSLAHSYRLPLEPAYLFHATMPTAELAARGVDEFGDSYARDVDTEELRQLLEGMDALRRDEEAARWFRDAEGLAVRDDGADALPGWMLKDAKVFVDQAAAETWVTLVRFAGGAVAEALEEGKGVTHVLVEGRDTEKVKEIRETLAGWRGAIPRAVTGEWLQESLVARTLLDEERFAPSLVGV